ncbi:hypothetical protein MASR1M46_12710 [Bacteroidales bacterium]
MNINPANKELSLSFRDTSVYKQSVEVLKASEEKYRRLFDNAIVGVFVTSLDGNFLYVNKALQIFTRPNQQLII